MTDGNTSELQPSRPLNAQTVTIGPHRLKGFLSIPPAAQGLIIFAHGSGSGRFSPRNNYVAQALQRAGLATLLLDLLTPEEELFRPNVFDIPLLASRLDEATLWVRSMAQLLALPVGYFGASTGAGAALLAAAQDDAQVRAVVSRGGRPDLAGSDLTRVRAPTLLLVGSLDTPVIDLNRQAKLLLRCPNELVIIPGATHLFEEPGTLDAVIDQAIRWFKKWLPKEEENATAPPFADRQAAGIALSAKLARFKASKPLILALPRGGVPVAYEIAKALDGELDLLLVRKLGAPGHPEVGIGAVVDGAHPQFVFNRDIVRRLQPAASYIEAEARNQLHELERRRQLYVGKRPPPCATGRTVIVVDDGVATGVTVRAALQALRQNSPAHLVLAVPVAPREALADLASECDELVCLASPEPFFAVGAHYDNFDQTSDEEVVRLLAEAGRQRSKPAHAV